MFDDFGEHNVVFLPFSFLYYSGKLCSSSINNILYFFLFKHGLREVSSLRPVLKVTKLLVLCFSIIRFVGYYKNKEYDEAVIFFLYGILTGSHNLIKNRYIY